VPGGKQILQHAHLRKQLAVLEGTRNTETCDMVRRLAGDALAAKPNATFSMIEATDAIECAGLAGAVRADQGEQFAAFDGKRHIVEYDETAEAQRQMLDLELSHTISGCADTV
jgi:hypothetical protein